MATAAVSVTESDLFAALGVEQTRRGAKKGSVQKRTKDAATKFAAMVKFQKIGGLQVCTIKAGDLKVGEHTTGYASLVRFGKDWVSENSGHSFREIKRGEMFAIVKGELVKS